MFWRGTVDNKNETGAAMIEVLVLGGRAAVFAKHAKMHEVVHKQRGV